MQAYYTQLQREAYRIASGLPLPSFYLNFQPEHARSWQSFLGNELILDLRRYVERNLEDDFGHGLLHVTKVTLDAGTLALIEGAKDSGSDAERERQMILAQCAGLLHDMKRKSSKHAEKSAALAREILPQYPLTADEVEDIALAIANHEAFQHLMPLVSRRGQLLSDCLYDADKFRWGPDNFTETLWFMASYYNAPRELFLDHFPSGMEGVARIASTFRTASGRKYGPEFIEQGLKIGREIFAEIKNETIS